MCLHTHRASQSLRDFCHHAVNHYPSRAVLFEISDLFCSPEGVYCSQHSLGRCLDCVLTGSQLALVQSSAIRSLARPRICSPWEKGATRASISQGGVGSLRDTGRGGSSQVNFPWVTMRSCGCGICKSVGSGLKSRLPGMVQGELLSSVSCAKHMKLHPQILQDSCTQKRFLPQVFM